MPNVIKEKGYRFYFFSNESNEPMHVHIKKAGANGKMWLYPEVKDEYFYGFTLREIKEIRLIVNKNLNTLINKWNEYFKK